MFAQLMTLIASLFAPTVSAEKAELSEIIETHPPDSIESLKATVRLLQLNAAEAARPKVKRLTVSAIKVSEKGGINFFGLRRFPVNMYLAELEAILKSAEDGTLARFIESNRDHLSLSKVADESK